MFRKKKVLGTQFEGKKKKLMVDLFSIADPW